MEPYDFLGRWRDRYAKKIPLNATGNMPDGTAINGPVGIRDYLKKRPAQFTRCLTEKLWVYAMGRRISFTVVMILTALSQRYPSTATVCRN